MIDVMVGPSEPRKRALAAAAQPIPAMINIRALIDTGAGPTCLDPTIVSALGLTATGTIQMITPSTGAVAVDCNQYDVHLMLVHPAISYNFHSQPVVESILLHQGFQMLLGRDVLAMCHFSYQGYSQAFSLCF